MKTFFQKIFLLGVMMLLTLGASATPDRNYLCFTANTDESSVRLEECTPDETPYFVNLEYSHDGSNWSEYNIGSIVDLLHAGDKVYFRNADDGVAAGFSLSSHGYYAFNMSGSIAASGNIMSLIDKSCASTTIPCASCFFSLLSSPLLITTVCTMLTRLPATQYRAKAAL